MNIVLKEQDFIDGSNVIVCIQEKPFDVDSGKVEVDGEVVLNAWESYEILPNAPHAIMPTQEVLNKIAEKEAVDFSLDFNQTHAFIKLKGKSKWI